MSWLRCGCSIALMYGSATLVAEDEEKVTEPK
jgi:hypothetical protein